MNWTERGSSSCPSCSSMFYAQKVGQKLRPRLTYFLLTQPAHLQKIQGKKLEGDIRRAARAEFIRQRLNGN